MSSYYDAASAKFHYKSESCKKNLMGEFMGSSSLQKNFVSLVMTISIIIGGIFLFPMYIDHRIQQFLDNNQYVKTKQPQELVSYGGKTLEKHSESLYSGLPTVNHSKSAKRIVVFSDYRCVFCKKMEKEISSIPEMKGVNIIYQEFPVLGEDSEKLAEMAYKADQIGMYYKYRNYIGKISSPTAVDAENFFRNFPNTGSEYIQKSTKGIRTAKIIAKDLNITGTPAIIVGEKVIRGWSQQAVIDALNGKP